MSTDHGLEPQNLIADAIDGAEEMYDPLDGLAEKTVADPGAPFSWRRRWRRLAP